MTVLSQLPAIERALTSHGFPPMSPWWADTIRSFYESGRRSLVLRVGRRGGKSSTLCRLAVLEALDGGHVIPPGDVGIVAIISVSRDEASARLRTIEAVLRALGVDFKRSGESIELTSRPIIFKVYSASIAGVSGFTCICAICDEAAKWRDVDTGANPAREVIASLRPSMATMPSAKLFISSSPFSVLDHHYELFERGDTDDQLTAYAPTWVANPTITEQQTRSLESDARVWGREYLAVPSASIAAVLDPDDVKAAVRRPPPIATAGSPCMFLDMSSGGGDSLVMMVGGWVMPSIPNDAWERRDLLDGNGNLIEANGSFVVDGDGHKVIRDDFEGNFSPVFIVDYVDAIEGSFRSTMRFDRIVETIGEVAEHYRVRAIFGDQHAAFPLESAFSNFESIAWTQPRKQLAAQRMARWFREQIIILPEHDEMQKQLCGYSERLTQSGSRVYSGKGRQHDDMAATILLMAHCDVEGMIPMSPSTRQLGGRRYRSMESGRVYSDVQDLVTYR